VNGNGTPTLDSRSAQDFYTELTAVQPAFVPELAVLPQGTVAALLQIVARFSSIIVQRLNQAPDLDKLAFLDMLGISLIPAQPARAPLVFTPLPLQADSQIPAGTRAGASPPGAAGPTVFETENNIALTTAELTQVVSLWPDQDGYVNHSSNVAGGRQFTLFENLSPVDHVLYLSEKTLLAFKGKSTVEVRFTLATSGSKSVSFRWEFWDGKTWRAFRDFDATDPAASHDGTAGLTRSGVVTLEAECGDSASTSVSNISNYWIRGRLTAPLPPDPSRTFAVASQIELRTTIDRPLTHGYKSGGCRGDAQIDAAYAGTTTLDITKIFYPLGKAPGTDAAFYFVSEEVFSKPGAKVTLCIDLSKTPEQEGDTAGPKYAAEVTQAEKDLVKVAQDTATSAADTATTIVDFMATQMNVTTVNADIGALNSAISGVSSPPDIANLKKPMADLLTDLQNLQSQLPIDGSSWLGEMSVGGYFLKTLNQNYATFQEAQETINSLADITAVGAAGAVGVNPPVLSPPQLVWEYYNGNEWNTLVAPSNNDAANLMKSGEITFTVPQDISPFVINGSPALGMRARLHSGSYNVLLLVSWTDPTSGQTNFIPVIQPRPPALSHIAIGYVYRSAWHAPDQSLTWNDFMVESHTPTATHAAANYAPYHPVSDTLPALYLGFNQPLPNDYLSMFFDIVESDTDGPPLAWEAWSAGTWQRLTVSDDTSALARSGMVAFLDPGVPARPSAIVTSASGSLVTASNALAAAVFQAGDQIVVQPDKAAEVALIDSINGANIHLVTPLAGTYTSTTAVLAALPRFGTSLDWVRARLKTDGTPELSRVNGIYPNAVWGQQVQTINNETLGSGTGQPSQSLFFQQFPVLEGEQVQVRELVGAQANVEFLVLQEQLTAQGFTSNNIRTVVDSRSGLITEVWVTWVGQPNFYFSGPTDRHYVLDRASGRIIFGDGINGMLPTPGNSNLKAYWYRAGGGLAGNFAAGVINQVLGGAVAQSVTNPAAAEGGADTEAAEDISWRGPQVLRHRGSALAAADYEALALEASPGVAITRCLPATTDNLLPVPGWVTLILVPHSLEPQPKPSYELKQEVAAYIGLRAPSVIGSGRISVIPPNYLPVGVSASVAAQQIDQSGIVKTAVIAALNQFFHPLYGGPDGRGWPFGRDVYLSDVAKILEAVDGVDYVQQLELLLDLIPAGDQVTVPPERMVAAGPMLIVMEGAPNA
jgi:predicted phage baseplate assembly protein